MVGYKFVCTVNNSAEVLKSDLNCILSYCRMLFAFAEEKGDTIAVTYLISGILKETGLHEFRLIEKKTVEGK